MGTIRGWGIARSICVKVEGDGGSEEAVIQSGDKSAFYFKKYNRFIPAGDRRKARTKSEQNFTRADAQSKRFWHLFTR